VRLDDDVQPTRTYEAVSAWEGQTELIHDLSNANGRGTGDSHTTMHQSGGAISTASFCRMKWSVRIQ
jgi:hypothetical protein